MQRIPSSINAKCFPHTCRNESVVKSLGEPLSITKEVDDWDEVFERYITNVTIKYLPTVIELLDEQGFVEKMKYSATVYAH